jgi:nucleoside-diphosphate-sugar epimerase
LTAEALCLSQAATGFRVARLSNVIGPGDAPLNFVASVLQEARSKRKVLLHTGPKSARDYVDIKDVCAALEAVALRGTKRLYNVGSGTATSNAEIAAMLAEHLGVATTYDADSPTVTFPLVDISRIRAEFAFSPTSFATSFLKLIRATAGEGAT